MAKRRGAAMLRTDLRMDASHARPRSPAPASEESFFLATTLRTEQLLRPSDGQAGGGWGGCIHRGGNILIGKAYRAVVAQTVPIVH